MTALERHTLWNQFLSSLAHAEQAAADQCEIIASELEKSGNRELAKMYKGFAEEERGHFQLVNSVCKERSQLSKKAKATYAGKLMSPNASVVERMAVVHLAFEPSALAFLGHLFAHADEHFSDKAWATQIRDAFGTILREEVAHIHSGKEAILDLIEKCDEKTRKDIKKSLRRHKAFLSLGLKSFFPESTRSDSISGMIQNYHQRFETAVQGVA